MAQKSEGQSSSGRGLSPWVALVFTEAEVAERIGHPATLEHKIWSKGKKLYEAA